MAAAADPLLGVVLGPVARAEGAPVSGSCVCGVRVANLVRRAGAAGLTSPPAEAAGGRPELAVQAERSAVRLRHDPPMKVGEARAALRRCQTRFPLDDVREWASRYEYRADDQHVIDAIGPAVRRRGHYLRDEFVETYRWKTERTVRRAERYTDEQIADVTGVAFRQADEQLRIELLRALDGVDYPVASVLLHVGLSEDYPIIDYRALWSLGSGQPTYYSFGFWWSYVECCRGLASAAGVSVREFDKALWAYSDANQPEGTG